MLFIVIAALAFIVGGILAGKGHFNIPLMFITVIFFTLGLTPISGYEEPVLKNEYQLKCINEPATYVIFDGNEKILCKHYEENNSSEGKDAYQTYDYNDNVDFVVTEKGSKPIVKHYEVKAKRTLLTIAWKCDKEKYVFYVPEENIEKWEKEHIN